MELFNDMGALSSPLLRGIGKNQVFCAWTPYIMIQDGAP